MPFDAAADYLKYVDGKNREDGSGRSWTAAESSCPRATPRRLRRRRDGVRAGKPQERHVPEGPARRTASRCSTDRVAIWRRSRPRGCGIAVVSSSANTREVLEITGLDRFVQQRVDGVTLREEHIAGKPAPDSYLRARSCSTSPPTRRPCSKTPCPAWQAGHAGNFGFVVGVDRVGQAEDLRRNGADVVVTDLAELLQSMITEDAFPVEPGRSAKPRSTSISWHRPSRCSRCPTATSGCAATSTRASRTGCPAPTSTRSTKCARCPTPRRATDIPEDGQTLVDVTNGKIIRLLVDDEPFDVRYGELLDHERVLDMRAGTLTRDVHWRSPAGKQVKVTSTRLVSLAQRSVAAIEYVVEAVDEFVRVTVQSELVTNEDQPPTSNDPRVSAILDQPAAGRPPRMTGHAERLLMHRTQVSKLMMAAAMDHDVEVPGRVEVDTNAGEDLARTTVICGLRPGQKLRIVKYLAYGWSSLRSRPALRDQAAAALTAPATAAGRACWTRSAPTWTTSGTAPTSRSRATPTASRRCGSGCSTCCRPAPAPNGARSPARDSPGPATTATPSGTPRDSSSRCSPTPPARRRGRTAWRASTLDLAKERAAELDLDGAGFPWRTIRGQECSAYWPAGTAAWHINADIAMAFERYRIVTGDQSLEAECGLAVLVETARLWLSLGHHDRHGVWHLDGVTGPDEYTAVVRDNMFTNLMAAHNLRTAAEACVRHPEAARAMGVTTEEMAAWRDAADAVRTSPSTRGSASISSAKDSPPCGVGLRDDTTYPLLLHQPYVRLYPAQVIKQADLVLAMHWQATPSPRSRRRATSTITSRGWCATPHCRRAPRR